MSVSNGMRSCGACRSTGSKKVKAGKGTIFQHKKKCKEAATRQLPIPPMPMRVVNCDACSGLGILETLDQSSLPACVPAFTGRICVIGGGIGGLAFALAGLHRGLNITVFEKDGHFSTRSQGYALTMQQGFTQLRKLGFTVDQLRAMGTTSTGHVTLDQNGGIIGRTGRDRWGCNGEKEAKRFNIQLPRQHLRHELLSALPADTVKWGKKLTSVATDDRKVYFSDNSSATYDLIVGADGIRSHFVSQYPLQYLGVIVILGRGSVKKSNKLNLGVDKIWQTVDGVTRMYAMPFGIEGETMWQLSWKCSEEEAKSFGGSGSLLLAEAKSRVAGWHDPWMELLDSTSLDDVTGYPAYDRWPIPQFEDLCPRVAVLGDAAHPLSPFKGQGANQALADGVDLATLLCAGLSGVDGTGTERYKAGVTANGSSQDIKADEDSKIGALIKAFHARMTDRVGVKVEQSRAATSVLHSHHVLAKGDHTRGKVQRTCNSSSICTSNVDELKSNNV